MKVRPNGRQIKLAIVTAQKSKVTLVLKGQSQRQIDTQYIQNQKLKIVVIFAVLKQSIKMGTCNEANKIFEQK